MPVRIFCQHLGKRRRIEGRSVRAGPAEGALGLDLHHLQIGDRGLKLGVPIDEPLVLVYEPFAIELREHLGDRAREALVEREPLAAPVAGGAEALELRHDRSPGLRLPRPDALDERLAAKGAPIGLLPLHEHAFDDHLRRDAGMVDAWLPQHVTPVHAPISAQDILQCIVERVPHMQIAGDVRRRNHDAKRLRRRPFRAARPERSRLLPKRGGAAFDRGEVKGFVHHGTLVRAMPCRSVDSRSESGSSERRSRPRAPKSKRRGGYKRIVTAEVNARSWAYGSPTSARAPLALSPRAPIARQWPAGSRRATA